MEYLKVEVKNLSDANEAQDLFEKLGIRKGFFDDDNYPKCVVTGRKSNGDWYSSGALMSYKRGKTITIAQLKDLVVLHRNDVKDATHMANDGFASYYYSEDKQWYTYADEGWYNIGRPSLPFHELQKQGLISGAEAKLAWAKGEDVYGRIIPFRPINEAMEWHPIADWVPLNVFDREDYEFMVKPKLKAFTLHLPETANIIAKPHVLTIEFEDRNAPFDMMEQLNNGR